MKWKGCLLALLCAGSAVAMEPQAIIDRANLVAFYPGSDGRAQARMKIIDDQGRQQLRQFTILRKNHEPGGRQDLLVFFSRPSDVKGTVFRVVRQPGQSDDRWLYLPGLDLIKRISAGDQRTSFVGSDFFYEDVSGRAPDADQHALEQTTEDVYQLLSTPKSPDEVEFSHYRSWIDKTTFLPMKVEYLNQQGEVVRRMSVQKVEVISGHPTAVQATIEDLERGSKTVMQVRGVVFELGLPDTIFSERSMRTPPMNWILGR